ncbi:universal stress protein [Enterococcus sp. AZ103]|uniref:universal stress protein n=1 Tax=Enterococcus sp. AZ103 TaxID=2774628 RepID=UPI003F23076D
MREVYQKILVAVDGSEQAHNAFLEALSVTRRNSGKLFLLSVADTSHLAGEPYAVNYAIDAAKKAADGVVENLKEKIPEDVDYTIIEAEGNPKLKIIEAAEELKIDLIMMGTTGTGTFSRLLVGSTTSYVVNNAPCNVMVVR